MLHVAMISMSGFRVREQEMLALGMTLPRLRQRAATVGALPSLGLLTLAGMTPARWEVSYHEAGSAGDDDVVQKVMAMHPALAAISAPTASADEAYRLAAKPRTEGVPVVMGGLHAMACPEEALRHVDTVVIGDGEPVWPLVLDDATARRLMRVYRASRPFDLRRAPMPRFDLLGPARARYTVQTARGCPMACDFCGASRVLGPFREKPAARVAEELAAIRMLSCGRPVVEPADDNTFAGRRDPGELLSVPRCATSPTPTGGSESDQRCWTDWPPLVACRCWSASRDCRRDGAGWGETGAPGAGDAGAGAGAGRRGGRDRVLHRGRRWGGS